MRVIPAAQNCIYVGNRDTQLFRPLNRRAAHNAPEVAPYSAIPRRTPASAGPGDRRRRWGGHSTTPCAAGGDTQPSARPPRLFSNLNAAGEHEPGTVWGAALLVAGTTVGAGILALPTVTQPAGFIASSTALGATCVFSIITGLLIAEVNINTMCELGAGGVSLVTMAERTLSKRGAWAASAAYIFLHYALIVAYISKAGQIVGETSDVPAAAAAVAFSLSISGFCYAANQRVMDQVNSFLVLASIVAFLDLLAVASNEVAPELLLRSDFTALPDALPVIALAFVYQNIVPVIVSSLECDVSKIRTAVVAGSLIPLAMFVSWEAAVLGSSALGGAAVADPLVALQESSTTVGPLIQGFSFLAVATSYIGFILGLTDFLADALKLPAGRQQPLPYALTVVPPTAIALTYPDIFLSALDVAGTYGVLTLFGLLPSAMAWSERYRESTLTKIEVVGGGRPVLLGTAGLAAAVILNEVVHTVQDALLQ